MNTEPRIAALSTGPATHLDHLGVLCAVLNFSLLVSEESTYQTAKAYYPELDVRYMDYRELSLNYLAQNYEMLLGCGKFWAIELLPLLELLHHKKMRLIFCPHGNSDKGHSTKAEANFYQDIALVYGDHMIDLLKRTGSFDKIGHTIVTGNYRLPYYLKHQKFYEGLVSSTLVKIDRGKKTILYAPTWQDSETPTSFFQATARIIEELGSHYNLIIKLHPFLEEHHPAHTYHLIAKYEHLANVVFLTQFPPIYPLLALSDIYLGDFSSIGYDFLAFDRPMFFFNPMQSDSKINRGLFLHRCGQEIPLNKNLSLRAFIEDNVDYNTTHFAKLRKETYDFAFGNPKDPSNIREEILNVYRQSSRVKQLKC